MELTARQRRVPRRRHPERDRHLSAARDVAAPDRSTQAVAPARSGPASGCAPLDWTLGRVVVAASARSSPGVSVSRLARSARRRARPTTRSTAASAASTSRSSRSACSARWSITGEYATGSIRSTFAAVPRRLPVLWSKLGVFLAVTFVLGTLASVLAFFAGQAIFSRQARRRLLRRPARRSRRRSAAGSSWPRWARFGLALGALLRNTAGRDHDVHASLLFVVPVIVDVLPKGEKIGPYLPPRRG